MAVSTLRQRYASDGIGTASSAELLIRLYDRLVADVTGAADAIDRNDFSDANRKLVNAQEIITALRSALDPNAWKAAAELDQVYGFVLKELITANIQKDAVRARTCLDILEPLRSAWREAKGAAAVVPGAQRSEFA